MRSLVALAVLGCVVVVSYGREIDQNDLVAAASHHGHHHESGGGKEHHAHHHHEHDMKALFIINLILSVVLITHARNVAETKEETSLEPKASTIAETTSPAAVDLSAAGTVKDQAIAGTEHKKAKDSHHEQGGGHEHHADHHEEHGIMISSLQL
ncbi:unnamed protein product [Arctia plantaginis]|uniref:Uncharacterized protein n=1 Tax=Arctia plantaginis TaxID=874455 RepID=A0A8S0YZQ7_ARCPL|nr:unnamed protein product [Arctia plantaginis]